MNLKSGHGIPCPLFIFVMPKQEQLLALVFANATFRFVIKLYKATVKPKIL